MMIAHPPQQQIHSYHLALSIILLVLTVYPHLFNSNGVSWSVAAYSGEDFHLIHNQIDKFDLIDSDDLIMSRSISTRATQESQLLLNLQTGSNSIQYETQVNELNQAISQEAPKKVQFSSLGRRFNLVLRKPFQLVTDDFSIVTLDANGTATKFPYNRDNLQILNGFVDGDPESSASASFNAQDKLMTAQIKTGLDTIIVEPTYLHLGNFRSSTGSNLKDALRTTLYNKTMIVYNLRDHKQFQPGDMLNTSNLFNLGKLCKAVNMSEYTSTDSENSKWSHEDELKNQEIANIFKIYKGNKFMERKKHKRGIEFLTESPRDRTRCTLHLVADYLFYKHVGNGDLQTTINYLLALINRVNQIYLPTVWETGGEKESFSNIGFTVQNITIHQEFTRQSSGDLHYNMPRDKVWGAREFLDNFSKNSPPKHYCLAHLLTYRQFDSPVLGLAYVASERHGTIGGICSPTQQRSDGIYKHNTGISTSKGISGETLITRQADLVLSHELGHNLGAEHDSNDCRPASTNGGAYLMHPYAVMGFERNNRLLSSCSRLSIGRVIRRKASTCFVGVVDHVCGNGVVEDDEQCDGGDIGLGHNDPCCDSSCRFTAGSRCSDRNSWCCSKCQVAPAGEICRPAEEFNCKQLTYCDGQSIDCPNPPPVKNDQICVGRGLCRDGNCIPFCEAKGLYSCLCTNPPDACKLCCRSTINGTCTPYDIAAPYLPDGVLCYRGVCEKGRCEQPIQDVIERLWDVIEDINFTTMVKFFRDNIILVVLVASIPIWCIFSHFINKFDESFKKDVVTAIMKHSRGQKTPPSQSPFLPRLFVGDEVFNELGVPEDPLKSLGHSQLSTNRFYPPPHGPGFRPPNPGFQSSEGMIPEPRGSIALNSMELPHQSNNKTNEASENFEVDLEETNAYSTEV